MIRRTSKNSTSNASFPPRRRGIAATEFALVLPVLVAIAMGCIDLGNGVYSYITLSNAVREGAMYGATTGFTKYTQGSWEAEIRDRVVEELSTQSHFNAKKLNLSVTTSTDKDGTVRLTVDGTYPFDTVIDWPGLPQQIDLNRQVSMQRFR